MKFFKSIDAMSAAPKSGFSKQEQTKFMSNALIKPAISPFIKDKLTPNKNQRILSPLNFKNLASINSEPNLKQFNTLNGP